MKKFSAKTKACVFILATIGASIVMNTHLSPQAKDLKKRSAQIKKGALPDRTAQLPKKGIDGMITSNPGGATALERWQRMKKELDECDDCGVKQPFPGD